MREYAAAFREANGYSLRANRKSPTAKSRHHLVPRKTRLMIYERDKWICQLCHEPVDKTLPSHNRLGATLDHIECQSWTLIPDHSPRNLRLVHRACNSRRYNGRAA